MLRCKVKAIPGIALMEPETKGAIAFAGKSKAYETKWEARAGARQFMESHAVRVENLDLTECKQLMRDFIRRNPALWNEDIGAL